MEQKKHYAIPVFSKFKKFQNSKILEVNYTETLTYNPSPFK